MGQPRQYKIPDPAPSSPHLELPASIAEALQEWVAARGKNQRGLPCLDNEGQPLTWSYPRFRALGAMMREAAKYEDERDFLGKIACEAAAEEDLLVLAMLHREYPESLDMQPKQPGLGLPLHRISSMKNRTALRWLAERVRDINSPGSRGLTLLHLLAIPDRRFKQEENAALFEEMLDLGADPNCAARNGETPMHRIASYSPTLLLPAWRRGGDLMAPSEFSLRGSKLSRPLDVLEEISHNFEAYVALDTIRSEKFSYYEELLGNVRAEIRQIEARVNTSRIAPGDVFMENGAPQSWVLQAAGVGLLPKLMASLQWGGKEMTRLWAGLSDYYRNKPEVECAYLASTVPLSGWQGRLQPQGAAMLQGEGKQRI